MYIYYSNFRFPSMSSKKSSTHWSLEVSCRCRCRCDGKHGCWVSVLFMYYNTQMLLLQIRVITKLPNSEQSHKGKVKTHKYINRQNQSKTGKLWKRNDPDLVQAFLKKWWVESDFKAPNLPLSLRLKGSGCHYNSIYNNTWTK
jgi:hypothetical protein